MDRFTSTIGAGTRGNAVLTGGTLASDFNSQHKGIDTLHVASNDCLVHLVENRCRYLRFQNLVRLHLDIVITATALSPETPASSWMITLPEQLRCRISNASYSWAETSDRSLCETSIMPGSNMVTINAPFMFAVGRDVQIVGDIFYEPYYTRLEEISLLMMAN